jgi:hypothetical protein
MKGTAMQADFTDRDKPILAQAMVMAAAYWDAAALPRALVTPANAMPLALYVALKYLQSLSDAEREESNETAMRAILLVGYPAFVKLALRVDPTPADLCAHE